MPETTTSNEPVAGLPEPPQFHITTKMLQIEAPSSGAIPPFRAAMAAALRQLQRHEQFMADANDKEAVSACREAQYTMHVLATGIDAVVAANYRELEAYQAAMAVYESQQENFGINFADQASPEVRDDQEDGDGAEA